MKDERNAMNCIQFEEIYHELDRPGTSGFRFRERALAHAESCARCGALLTDGEALDFALSSLAQQNAGREASARVEAALLREFQGVKLSESRRRIRRQLVALGTAAAVFLALGLGVQHRIASRAPTVQTQTASEARNAVAPVTSVSPTPHEPAPVANVTSKKAISNQADENEYAEEFVPVPYADDPGALEGGAIVRVTIPRSDLPSFGLPITESGGADRVSADLVISQDGTPQAIRLVSEASPN
jgi:hypothetical protein